jgi:hypothetical protein
MLFDFIYQMNQQKAGRPDAPIQSANTQKETAPE